MRAVRLSCEDLAVVFEEANARAIDDNFFAADLREFVEAGDRAEFRHWAFQGSVPRAKFDRGAQTK